MKPDENLKPKHQQVLSFAQQMKAGKGFMLVSSVLEGNYLEKYPEAQAAEQVRTLISSLNFIRLRSIESNAIFC